MVLGRLSAIMDEAIRELRKSRIEAVTKKIPMTYVTDTHAFVHHVTGRKTALGTTSAQYIRSVGSWIATRSIVPFTVLEEVMLLSEIGKIQIPLPFRDFVISLGQADNFDLAVNDTAHTA